MLQKISAIANHQVDLDEYAKANFDRIKKIASKDNYMSMLKRIYLEHDVYRKEQYQLTPVKIFRPAMPLATS